MDYAKLISALTAYDRRTAKSEERHGVPVNIYRLAHLFKAAQAVNEAVIDGLDPVLAFTDKFTPTDSNVRIAHRAGIDVSIHNGFWA